jgi:hypothetical protein
MGEERKVYKVLVGKPDGMRPLRRPRRKWEDGIRMGLWDIVWGVWSGFSWLRIGTGSRLMLSAMMNLWVWCHGINEL